MGFGWKWLLAASKLPPLFPSVSCACAPVRLAAVGRTENAVSAVCVPPTAVLDCGSGKVAHTLAGHEGGTNGVAFLSGNLLVRCGGRQPALGLESLACPARFPLFSQS